MKEDSFKARVRESGRSKVITIPVLVAESYPTGEVVEITIRKR